jgi:hypothetical protein
VKWGHGGSGTGGGGGMLDNEEADNILINEETINKVNNTGIDSTREDLSKKEVEEMIGTRTVIDNGREKVNGKLEYNKEQLSNSKNKNKNKRKENENLDRMNNTSILNNNYENTLIPNEININYDSGLTGIETKAKKIEDFIRNNGGLLSINDIQDFIRARDSRPNTYEHSFNEMKAFLDEAHGLKWDSLTEREQHKIMMVHARKFSEFVNKYEVIGVLEHESLYLPSRNGSQVIIYEKPDIVNSVLENITSASNNTIRNNTYLGRGNSTIITSETKRPLNVPNSTGFDINKTGFYNKSKPVINDSRIIDEKINETMEIETNKEDNEIVSKKEKPVLNLSEREMEEIVASILEEAVRQDEFWNRLNMKKQHEVRMDDLEKNIDFLLNFVEDTAELYDLDHVKFNEHPVKVYNRLAEIKDSSKLAVAVKAIRGEGYSYNIKSPIVQDLMLLKTQLPGKMFDAISEHIIERKKLNKISGEVTDFILKSDLTVVDQVNTFLNYLPPPFQGSYPDMEYEAKETNKLIKGLKKLLHDIIHLERKDVMKQWEKLNKKSEELTGFSLEEVHNHIKYFIKGDNKTTKEKIERAWKNLTLISPLLAESFKMAVQVLGITLIPAPIGIVTASAAIAAKRLKKKQEVTRQYPMLDEIFRVWGTTLTVSTIAGLLVRFGQGIRVWSMLPGEIFPGKRKQVPSFVPPLIAQALGEGIERIAFLEVPTIRRLDMNQMLEMLEQPLPENPQEFMRNIAYPYLHNAGKQQVEGIKLAHPQASDLERFDSWVKSLRTTIKLGVKRMFKAADDKYHFSINEVKNFIQGAALELTHEPITALLEENNQMFAADRVPEWKVRQLAMDKVVDALASVIEDVTGMEITLDYPDVYRYNPMRDVVDP